MNFGFFCFDENGGFYFECSRAWFWGGFADFLKRLGRCWKCCYLYYYSTKRPRGIEFY